MDIVDRKPGPAKAQVTENKKQRKSEKMSACKAAVTKVYVALLARIPRREFGR